MGTIVVDRYVLLLYLLQCHRADLAGKEDWMLNWMQLGYCHFEYIMLVVNILLEYVEITIK